MAVAVAVAVAVVAVIAEAHLEEVPMHGAHLTGPRRRIAGFFVSVAVS